MKRQVKLNRRRLVTVLVIASSICTFLGPEFGASVRGLTQWALAPLGDAGMYLASRVRTDYGDVRLTPMEVRRLIDDRDSLIVQVATIEAQRMRLWRQLDEIQGIRRRFGPIAEFPCTLIPARVVGASSLPYVQTRALNVGTRGNVAPPSMVTTRRLLTDRSKALPLPPRLAAITLSSLVGQITEAAAHTASLQLVIDPGFTFKGIPTEIRRDPNIPRKIIVMEGPAAEVPLTGQNNEPIPVVQIRGAGADGIIVEQVKAHHNVMPGDWLVTTGDSELLPVTVAVGQVRHVRRDAKYPRLVTLFIQPISNLAVLREVYIVCPLGPPGPTGPDQEGGRK